MFANTIVVAVVEEGEIDENRWLESRGAQSSYVIADDQSTASLLVKASVFGWPGIGEAACLLFAQPCGRGLIDTAVVAVWERREE